MTPKTYDRQTAKLIAALSENFPEITGGAMQNCIESMPRLAKRIGQMVERDAVFRYGIWMSLPADQRRPLGLTTTTDREYALERFDVILKTSRCWHDYWYSPNDEDSETEGLITRWAKLPFAAERLIKIPVSSFRSRPGPHEFEGTMECSIESATRVMLRGRGFAPGERVCFFCRLKGGDGRHDGSHFCISTAWNGDAELSVVHEAKMSHFSHVVFAERPV